jgi:hypothetical protein
MAGYAERAGSYCEGLRHIGAKLEPKYYSCKVLLAAKKGHKAIARLLLEKGAELKFKNRMVERRYH